MSEREQTIKRLRADLTTSELGRMRAACQAGVFHLKIAIEAFNGLGHETYVDDLLDFLEEAEEVHGVLVAALKEES